MPTNPPDHDGAGHSDQSDDQMIPESGAEPNAHDTPVNSTQQPHEANPEEVRDSYRRMLYFFAGCLVEQYPDYQSQNPHNFVRTLHRFLDLYDRFVTFSGIRCVDPDLQTIAAACCEIATIHES